jgi:heat shock protein HspQ
VVAHFIKERPRINFFSNLGKLFCEEDASKVWCEVAFANLIQNALDTTLDQPSAEEIGTTVPAF